MQVATPHIKWMASPNRLTARKTDTPPAMTVTVAHPSKGWPTEVINCILEQEWCRATNGLRNIGSNPEIGLAEATGSGVARVWRCIAQLASLAVDCKRRFCRWTSGKKLKMVVLNFIGCSMSILFGDLNWIIETMIYFSQRFRAVRRWVENMFLLWNIKFYV